MSVCDEVSFCFQVASVEKRCVEKEQRLRDVNEELKLKKTSLATKEGKGINEFEANCYCDPIHSGTAAFAGSDPGEAAQHVHWKHLTQMLYCSGWLPGREASHVWGLHFPRNTYTQEEFQEGPKEGLW